MDKWLGNKIVLRIFSLLLGVLLWTGVQYDLQGKFERTDTESTINERTIQNVSIRFVGLDENAYTLKDISSQYVTIKLRGTKKVLNQFNVADGNTRIIADLTNVKVGKRKVYLEARGYPDNIEVVIQPNYITLDVERLGEKQMEVQTNLIGAPLEGFVISEQKIEPNLAVISGLQSQVNRVDRVVAELDVNGLNTSIIGEYTLLAKDKNGTTLDVTVNPARVKIQVKIEKEIIIEPTNTPAPSATVEPQ